MTISMYHASVPVCVRMLGNLDAILAKAAAHAAKHEIDEAALINARLFPDMFPFARQVQIACDLALRGSARLAGEEPPSVEDKETTFAELSARIRQTIKTMQSYAAEPINAAADRTIVLDIRGNDMTFDGRSYLLGFMLPNVYFHITTAYNLLRHNGVPLGKGDFLGATRPE